MDGQPEEEFDPPLDPGIARAVLVLRAAGIYTYESCQGGPGHCFPAPTVRFTGGRAVGLRAMAAIMETDLPTAELRRVWSVIDQELDGPFWEITLTGPSC